MTIVAETYRYVVGVDTHAATHHYAVVETATGAVLDDAEFPTHAAGLARAQAWIGRRTGGELSATLISVEGTGSYGAGLAARLLESGYRVVDAPSPRRERGSAKTDQIDAVIAARGALPRESGRLAQARTGQSHATLKVLVTAREQMCAERTRALNALNALLRSTDLGLDTRRKVSRVTITTITAWRARHEPPPTQVARAEAVRLARRIRELDTEINANLDQIQATITTTGGAAATLLDLPGIGPVNAAIVLIAWSHPGRIHSEAAFARLGGVSPLETSSGPRHEHRLNRTGDRQLNRALHSIASNRMRHDPKTRDYLARRTHNGLSTPRVRRCLKRYIARQLHRHLEQPQPLDAT